MQRHEALHLQRAGVGFKVQLIARAPSRLIGEVVQRDVGFDGFGNRNVHGNDADVQAEGRKRLQGLRRLGKGALGIVHRLHQVATGHLRGQQLIGQAGRLLAQRRQELRHQCGVLRHGDTVFAAAQDGRDIALLRFDGADRRIGMRQRVLRVQHALLRRLDGCARRSLGGRIKRAFRDGMVLDHLRRAETHRLWPHDLRQLGSKDVGHGDQQPVASCGQGGGAGARDIGTGTIDGRLRQVGPDQDVVGPRGHGKGGAKRRGQKNAFHQMGSSGTGWRHHPPVRSPCQGRKSGPANRCRS